jgi:tetratricopeptide (TPR) repeat protein
MKKLMILFLLVSLTFAQSVESLKEKIKKNPNDLQTKFELAKMYHDKVRDEIDDKSDEAEELFKEILKKKRDFVEARAYYGSLLTLKGRDAYLPWNKLAYVEQGCDEMDKAVKIAPNNLELRILRSLNNIHLPDFFNRLTYCLEDFDFLTKNEDFAKYPKNIQQEVYYAYAKILIENEKVEKGLKLHKKVLEIDPQSDLAKKSKEILED